MSAVDLNLPNFKSCVTSTITPITSSKSEKESKLSSM